MDTEQIQPFVVSGLKATRIKLVRDLEEVDNEEHFFAPDMCHQVYGDNETIFGYQNLSINIFYNASTFHCYVSTSYDEKIEPDEEINLVAEDYMEKLNPWLPANYYTNRNEFMKCLSDKKKLKPFGKKIRSFTLEYDAKKGNEFEIYTCTNTDTEYRDFHQRIETLIVWFIDAANFIDIEDEKWRFYILYEKDVRRTSVVYYPIGYCTVYEYFSYPESRRYRISQFIIFPPFQNMGLGTELLKTVYKNLITEPNIFDITVEDPSDRFQLMRDFVDAKLCLSLPSFKKQLLKGDFSKEMIREARLEYRINEKQCRRIYEILRLYYSNLDDPNDYDSYKVMVMNRLNTPFKRHNKKFGKFLKDNPSLLNDHHVKLLEKNFDSLIKQYRRVINRIKNGNFVM